MPKSLKLSEQLVLWEQEKRLVTSFTLQALQFRAVKHRIMNY